MPKMTMFSSLNVHGIQQAYNHENFQTLRSAISKPSINLANLNPSQYEQWYYDYLDAQNCQKKYRPKNVYYDFFISLGETVLTTKNKKDFFIVTG